MKRLGHTDREHGIVMVEYVLALSLLVGGFVSAGVYLKDAARQRMESSTGAVKQMVPCGVAGRLTSEECY